MHQRPRWGTGEEVADHDQPVLANEDVVQDQRFAAGAEKAEHLLVVHDLDLGERHQQIRDRARVALFRRERRR